MARVSKNRKFLNMFVGLVFKTFISIQFFIRSNRFEIIWVTFVLLSIFVPQKLDATDRTIKIGLLINDDKFVEARHGAEMAIKKANEEGGLNGKLFQLVTRSMHGPWGAGSKEAVNLVFNEEVWAILGAHGGRNAHLVEQVIAKTQTVFVSAWASDPTLSQAFVPWYFSCVPNSNQQASVLVEGIYKKRKSIRTATISDNEYDSKISLNSFVNKLKIEGNPDPIQLFYVNTSQNVDNLLNKIDSLNASNIVLFGQSSASMIIIQKMRQKHMNNNIYGSLSILGENHSCDGDIPNYDDVVLVCSGDWFGPGALTFKKEYKKKYGRMPGLVAAYAFDGMNIIIEAIRKSGQDRGKLREAVSATQFEGVTGMIWFDGKGNRQGGVELLQFKNGIPHKI